MELDLLGARAMHPIAFQFKRAHLSTVALGRKIFRGTKKASEPDFDGVLDMTPARFDILFVIYGGLDALCVKGGWRGYIEMTELTRQLGLSRATISVAIKRLVELGLVRKYASCGRKKAVCLTKEGLLRIRRAFRLVFRQGMIARRFGRFFSINAPDENRRSWIDQAMFKAWQMIYFLGQHLGDRSETVYLFRRGLRWDPER